jgi:hypothetical protein
MNTLLKTKIHPGRVYRRQDLKPYSSNLDRELQILVKRGLLKKAFYGIYYCPEQSRFGELPPNKNALIQAFLKTDDFLAFSPNTLNSLGLGSTQLSNFTRVYNHKRHRRVILAGMTFDFRIRPYFPRQLTAEFLLVELLNEHLAMPEEIFLQPERLQEKLSQFNKRRIERLIKEFGKVYTRKIYAVLTAKQPHSLPS